MLCLSHSILQRMHSPVKHGASWFYTWCPTESAPGEQESMDMGWPGLQWWWRLQRLSLGNGQQAAKSCTAKHDGPCLWLCKTCAGSGGPLARVLKAGCNSPLTDPWKCKTSVMSERSSSTIIYIGEGKNRWEGAILAPLLLWSNRSSWISSSWKTSCLVLQGVLSM